MPPRPHPVKAVLAERRVTVRRFARDVEVNETTLSRVLNGFVSPWPALRKRAAVVLGLSEESLWHRHELEAAELVERTTAKQGLPTTVEDSGILARVAAVLQSSELEEVEAKAAAGEVPA